MIRLTNPRTGHEVRTDDESEGFWLAAGYVRQDEPKRPAKKAAPRRSKKSEN